VLSLYRDNAADPIERWLATWWWTSLLSFSATLITACDENALAALFNNGKAVGMCQFSGSGLWFPHVPRSLNQQ